MCTVHLVFAGRVKLNLYADTVRTYRFSLPDTFSNKQIDIPQRAEGECLVSFETKPDAVSTPELLGVLHKQR